MLVCAFSLDACSGQSLTLGVVVLANVTILDGYYVYIYATIVLPSVFCTTYYNLYDVTFTLFLLVVSSCRHPFTLYPFLD